MEGFHACPVTYTSMAGRFFASAILTCTVVFSATWHDCRLTPSSIPAEAGLRISWLRLRFDVDGPLIALSRRITHANAEHRAMELAAVTRNSPRNGSPAGRRYTSRTYPLNESNRSQTLKTNLRSTPAIVTCPLTDPRNLAQRRAQWSDRTESLSRSSFLFRLTLLSSKPSVCQLGVPRLAEAISSPPFLHSQSCPRAGASSA